MGDLSRKTAVLAWVISGFWAGDRPADAGQYAFLVGVSKYDEKELRPLDFPRSDVLEFAQVLEEAGFERRHMVLMHDDLQTLGERRYLPESSRIRKELALLLSGLAEDDLVIVALAGHGVQFRGDKKSYFCPIDAELEKRDTLIAFEEVYEALDRCGAGRKLLLVDACRDDPQSKLSRSRKTVDLESITRPQSEPLPKGIVALFSCSPQQQSFEHPPLKHGVFFYHVIDGMKGAADADRDGRLTLDELSAYTRDATQTYVRTKLNAAQNPQLKGEQSGVWLLRTLAPAEVRPFVNSIEMKLVPIRPGKFFMGSAGGEGLNNERPRHEVEITRAFFIGATEVTQAQYEKVVGRNPSWFSARGGGRARVSGIDTAGLPVESVSHEDALAFCRQLCELEKLPAGTYRLPSEAEWEYAARGGATGEFGPARDAQELDEFAWHRKNAGSRTQAAGRKKPNAFGLFDTAGNVWEWCGDWLGPYSADAVKDPAGPASGDAANPQRVLRGGGWLGTEQSCRPADRNAAAPDDRENCYGFRVVFQKK